MIDLGNLELGYEGSAVDRSERKEPLEEYEKDDRFGKFEVRL